MRPRGIRDKEGEKLNYEGEGRSKKSRGKREEGREERKGIGREGIGR